MSLTTPRLFYRPFEYPQFADIAEKQQSVHWLKNEIPMGSDMQDWEMNLSESEKRIIGNILKSFTQNEVLVGDYWRKVADWFPKPEICMMAATFSYFETIHASSYAMLNESLGLDNFDAFLQDKEAMDKVEMLQSQKGETIEDIATSLAVFSAFTEGVLIYSSFAVLLSFQLKNLMKGVGQIVSLSVRDELVHSMGGIELFNEMCKENAGLRERVQKGVIEAAQLTQQLENNFIDSVFELGDIPTISKSQLQEFIKARINLKLNEMGYESIFETDKELVKSMNWFYDLSIGKEFGDFFATRVTEYTQVEVKSEELW